MTNTENYHPATAADYEAAGVLPDDYPGMSTLNTPDTTQRTLTVTTPHGGSFNGPRTLVTHTIRSNETDSEALHSVLSEWDPGTEYTVTYGVKS
jgi:hypothetical protein